MLFEIRLSHLEMWEMIVLTGSKTNTMSLRRNTSWQFGMKVYVSEIDQAEVMAPDEVREIHLGRL